MRADLPTCLLRPELPSLACHHGPPACNPQPFTNGSPARGGGEVTINAADMDGRITSSDYYKHTDETRAFQQACRGRAMGATEDSWRAGRLNVIGAWCNRTLGRCHLQCGRDRACLIMLGSLSARSPQEWDEARARQDQQLESIETGLGHLKEIGAAMNDELQRHDILINEVGRQRGRGHELRSGAAPPGECVGTGRSSLVRTVGAAWSGRVPTLPATLVGAW